MNCFLVNQSLNASIHNVSLSLKKFVLDREAAKFSRYTFHFPLILVEYRRVLRLHLSDQLLALAYLEFALQDVLQLNFL